MKKNYILEYLPLVEKKPVFKRIFDLCFAKTLQTLDKKEKYRVSLTLVSKEEIHSLNKEYRDMDRPTDVLTFAFQEADVVEVDEYIDLGNIIISPEVAKDQCGKYNHPYEREMAFLFIHGLLHSFGYDHHRSKEEEIEMFALQNKILNSLPIEFYADMKKMKKYLLEAKSMSYSPYSHFAVGAVVMTRDRKYHLGFNIENSAYGDSMCAERVALYHTYAQGYKKDDIVAMGLITDSKDIGSPCGSCRQVMSELLNESVRIHIFNADMSQELSSNIEELFPYAFTKEQLQ